MDHTPRCEHPGCQPKPAPALPRKVLLLEDNKAIYVCRKHKTTVAKTNAEYINQCEWDQVDPLDPCTKRPVTMMLPPGQPLTAGEIAVCRVHKSIMSTQYASMRKESR